MENIAHYLVAVKRVTPIGFVGQQASRSKAIHYGLVDTRSASVPGFAALPE